MTAQAPANKTSERPPEPWQQRLIRTLLYGKNTDRAAKARARVGLAMLAFGGVYGIIAVRLVMFAVNGDTHAERRASRDAIATARPDILDRNGTILATDVKSPSLFSEPRRIIDKDEAIALDMDVAAKYIAVCAAIPPSAVNQLDLSDLNTLAWEIAGFFMSAASSTPKT